jgi:preprotein translocase subunit SecG
VTVLLVILYVLVCIFLILVVLLQQGKGADLAGTFGGGGSQTSFGPRSASNIMHRLTTGSFVLFVVMSLALAILSGKQRTSVMESVEVPAAEAAETGAGETGVAPGPSGEAATGTDDDAAGPDQGASEEADADANEAAGDTEPSEPRTE